VKYAFIEVMEISGHVTAKINMVLVVTVINDKKKLSQAQRFTSRGVL